MGKRRFKDFFEAWWFLEEHPIFIETFSKDFKKGNFQHALDIHVAKVDPKTRVIDFKDDAKNTLTEVWLECGPWDDEEACFTHDINLDCGGNSFEEAVVKLANLVLKHYGEGQETL